MANLYVYHQGANNDGQLWYSSNDDINWQEDIQVQNLAMSGSPSAVAYNGNLYVFHQGPDDNGQLWYSVFDGSNWAPDTLVQNLAMSGSPATVPVVWTASGEE